MLFTRQQQQNALKYCATSVEPTFPFVQRFLFVRKSLKAKGMSTSDVNAQQLQLQQRGTRRLAAGSLLMVQWPPFFLFFCFLRGSIMRIYFFTPQLRNAQMSQGHICSSRLTSMISVLVLSHPFPWELFLRRRKIPFLEKKRNVFKKRNCKFRRRKKKGARGRPVSQYLYK